MKGKVLFRRKSVHQVRSTEQESHQLHRSLGIKDLTAFGIAAIIGAGIFSTIGNASAAGGPAVSLLFVFTAIACGFSALCYAEFASVVPVSGSAYTYSYVAFGELLAWIIGWDLIMEYAIGNIAVAISWSDYFTGLLSGIGIEIPACLSMDYLTAMRGHTEAQAMLHAGAEPGELPRNLKTAWLAWEHAPQIGGLHLVADIPALAIVFLITWLVYTGIRETKNASNAFVILKVAVIITVILVGAFYVKPDNWSPFAPNGVSGILQGVAAVFFAYIGFDAISTTAEECKNPQKDLPRSMIYALIICTLLYILIALVLTGMVPYEQLAVGDPLAFVFQQIGMDFMAGIVSISAIIAMTGVLLVFQVGQPRIWMSMSRDGLLPPPFSRIHPRFKTPSFSTIITGLVVAIPALFMNLTEVTDLTSIGTLFAFVLVCGGVLVMETSGMNKNAAFKVPYINARYILPLVMLLSLFLIYYYQYRDAVHFVSFQNWSSFAEKLPTWAFIILAMSLTIASVIKKLSLIPVLGLLTNFYLMSELDATNWARFLIWLLIGLVIYFVYGIRKSRLNTSS